MYNRYVPQSDGSFLRSQMEDNVTLAANEASSPPTTTAAPISSAASPDALSPSESINPSPAPTMSVHPETGNGGNFLSGLLHRSFDTEDMIIILLLLLLGNARHDQNAALLTLVLYLFL